MPVEHFTTHQEATLGKYEGSGRLLYKDLDAFYCHTCGEVFGVECPRCHCKAPRRHLSTEDFVIRALRPISGGKYEGFYWVNVECQKCDFTFRVIRR